MLKLDNEITLKGAIFDVDGTLYKQLPVRAGMALRLFLYYSVRPARFRELKGVLEFRKLRETEEFRCVSFDGQIKAAAHKTKCDPDSLMSAVTRHMMEEPLRLIAKYENKTVTGYLRKLQSEGKYIVVYSDYPAEDKLIALNISPDALFYPGKGEITELKPSRNAMETILSSIQFSPEELVFVGDRNEKDGASASLCGIRFIHIKDVKYEKVYQNNAY